MCSRRCNTNDSRLDRWGNLPVPPDPPLVRSAHGSYAPPVRIPRRLERFILGTMMSLVAIVAERRVVKALGKKRG